MKFLDYSIFRKKKSFTKNKYWIKTGLSPSNKINFFLPFKNDEKCFLFYLISSFCSQDI